VVPVYNETRSGTVLTVDGVQFTPEELVAMVLTHAVDISVAYAAEGGSTIAPPRDMVLTVPAYATVAERRALLDAATLADMNVLTLIDENTAAALHYAMDKNFEDKEQLLLFYNLGASALQVSVIRFFNYDQPQKYGKPKSVPALEVLSKAWDETCGGQAFDHLLVEYLADQFNIAWHKAMPAKKDSDVRSFPRAMTKLRLQANKIKHVLSANMEIPVHMDAVHDEISLQTHITRTQLEELAGDLLKKAISPIQTALAAANKTVADLTGMELIGGGMRIPRIQQEIKAALGEEFELGMHINSDESFALGAAFAGANISTAFRVRAVGMTDVNPFPIGVSLTNLPGEGTATSGDDKDWSKQATIFKSFGKIGVKKTIAFTHDRDIHCGLDYDEHDLLPAGTERGIVRYNISGVADFAKEMEEKGLGKPKVSLQFELSASGITSLIKAEAAVEETYTVEEEVEVDDDEAAENATEATEEPMEKEREMKEKKDEETREGEMKKDDSADAKSENKTDAKSENITDAKSENITDAKSENKTKTEKAKKKPKKKILVQKVSR
jgi:hypoxia up-regulated 1